MKRIVYLSNRNNKTSEKFYEEILKLVETGQEEKFYYILPNGEIINYYRERLLRDLKSHFSINLYTFDDIVDNILSLGKETIIGEEIKYLIVSKVLKKMKEANKLNYYGKFVEKEGFILSILEIIGGLKRDFIRSEDFLETLDDQSYYREIGLIYKEYEDYLIRKELLDREELYFKAIEQVGKMREGLNIKNIYIDKFYDFRPIELKLLKELARSEVNIFINMDFKSNRENAIVNNSLAILKDMGFEIEELAYREGLFKDLAYNLFSNSGEELDARSRVKIIEATSPYLEVKRVMDDIKLNIARKEDLRDISITILDKGYLDILDEVSKSEKLPINFLVNKSLASLKISKELLNILKLGLGKNFKEALLNRVNSVYFTNLDPDEKWELYTFFKNLNIKNLEEIKNLLGSGSLAIDARYLKILLEFVENISLEIESLLVCSSIEAFNTYIRDLFIKYNLVEEVLNEGNIEKLARESEKLIKISEVLDSIDKFSSLERSIGLEDYINLFEKYLENKSIKHRNRQKDGLKIFDLINNRGFTYKRNYILGLGQDKYPQIMDGNFFIQERNRSLLVKLGLDYKSYEGKMDNEIVKIGELISSTEEELILSYSSGEEGEISSSIFLDEITRNLKNYGKEKVGFDYIFKEDLDLITSEVDYKTFILLKLANNKAGDYRYDFEENWLKRLNFGLRPIIKRQEGLNSYSGVLREGNILKDLEGKFQNMKFSATSLEKYNKCPFNFFMDNILGLGEVYEEDLEIDYLEIGRLYHKVLKDFYERYYKADMEDEEVRKIVVRLFNEYLAEEVGNENPFNKLVYEDRLEKLLDFIYMDIGRNKREGLSPWKFEYGFGYNEDFEIGGVKIFGRIDRIDQRDNKLIIKDYKSSGSFGTKEMEEGISLQMPIYIMSQKEKNPIVGEYGLINKGEYDLGLEVKGSIKEFSRKRKNRLEVEEFEELLARVQEIIVGSKENILKGNFPVDPKLCSEFCPYKNICRYEGS